MKGEIFGIVAMLVAAGAGIAWIEFMLRAMRPVEDECAHGDIPHLHGEMRLAAISSPGRGADQTASHGTHSQIPLIAPREPSV